jgi:hypothetical protein
MAQSDIPAIDLAHAFSMRIDSGGRLAFEGEMRTRTFEPASGGEIWGPKLQGRVVPQSGADFASNNQMDAHLMLQASDGTWIYMNLLGYEHTQTEDGSPYFRVTPYFDAPQGPWAWLAKTVFIGTAERRHDPAHTLIHFYELL